MTVNETARLILEASTGMHGDIAKKLADAWAVEAERNNHPTMTRSERLSIWREAYRNEFCEAYSSARNNALGDGPVRKVFEDGFDRGWESAIAHMDKSAK